MRESFDINNSISSRRTLERFMHETKVQSALDVRFSITKSTINKTILRRTSENSIRNALSFGVAALPTHFIVGKELDKVQYEMLSNDATNTIDLVSVIPSPSCGPTRLYLALSQVKSRK